MMQQVTSNYHPISKVAYKCTGCGLTYEVNHKECPYCTNASEHQRDKSFLIQMIIDFNKTIYGQMKIETFWERYKEQVPHEDELKTRYNLHRLGKKFGLTTSDLGFPLNDLR